MLFTKFTCASCNSCYVGETSRHLSTRIREHLNRDRTSHIFQHLLQSEACRNSCSAECFRPCPHVYGYFRIRNFFVADSKSSPSTRSVFKSYSPVHTYPMVSILGDPGATSRDDAIFSGERHFWRESLFQGLKEPLGTFPYQTSFRSVEIRPADWPEKYFSGQSTRRSSRVILSPFYTKCFSSSIEREDFRKKRFDEAEEIANHKMGASNTLPSIFLADLSKVYRKTHECRVFLKKWE